MRCQLQILLLNFKQSSKMALTELISNLLYLFDLNSIVVQRIVFVKPKLYQQPNVHMHYCIRFHLDDQEDMEDIPNEFDQSAPALSSQYDSNNSYVHSRVIKLLADKTHISTVSPKQFIRKTNKLQAQRMKKLNQLKQQQENRVLADCTFQPQINKNRSKDKSQRNIQQFLQSQQRYLDKINNKRQQLKKYIEAQEKKTITFSPRINQKIMQRNKQNVHQRLYKLKNKDNTIQQSYIIEQSSHTPKISKRSQSIIRKVPIDKLLYEDAKRRAQKYDKLPQQINYQIPKDYNQEKYVAQRLLKDFKNVLERTLLKEKTTLNQIQIQKIMYQLGFVSSYQSNSLNIEEKQLLQNCYKYLLQFGVTQINLYVFLLALGGIYNVDLNNQELVNVIVIDEAQGRKIHKYFDLLFRNRLYSDARRKRIDRSQDNNSYTPSINRESQVLASKYRQKMVQRTNNILEDNKIDIKVSESCLTHSDLLVIHNLGKNLQKQKNRKDKLNEKDPECTFQPNQVKYPRNLINRQIMEDKCLSLYQYAKKKQEKDQINNISKLTTDVNHSPKNRVSSRKQNHSISPNKSRSIIKSNINSYLQVKDADKALSRMINGRQQRDQKRLFEERGQLTVKRQCSKKKQNVHSSEKELILEADIFVQNLNRKIYIYRGEENKLEQIVNSFCISYNLDKENREMLHSQLFQALQSI